MSERSGQDRTGVTAAAVQQIQTRTMRAHPTAIFLSHKQANPHFRQPIPSFDDNGKQINE